MLVKCKSCGNKIDRNVAFNKIIDGKNNYYCNEKEYIKVTQDKEYKSKIIKICNEIFGYEIINTLFKKELNSLNQVYQNSKIYNYLFDNKIKLIQIMNKNFSNEYGKIKYFITVLKNNLTDYVETVEDENKKEVQIEYVTNIYKPKCRKKTISEYIQEYEE